MYSNQDVKKIEEEKKRETSRPRFIMEVLDGSGNRETRTDSPPSNYRQESVDAQGPRDRESMKKKAQSVQTAQTTQAAQSKKAKK